MLRAQPGSERASLGFREAVTSEFDFLVKNFSFTCVKQDVTYVRYESSDVFVNVYHGRASFELNVEIGERAGGRDIPETRFTIGDILYLFSPQVAENYHPYQVTTLESVKKFVGELARLVEQYATPALRGDHNCFQRVAEIQLQRSNNLLQTWELNRVRREVETAWREKDFKRVVEIYDPVKEHLTPAEVKKLEYARKKCFEAD
jgi:hypothetical protein